MDEQEKIRKEMKGEKRKKKKDKIEELDQEDLELINENIGVVRKRRLVKHIEKEDNEDDQEISTKPVKVKPELSDRMGGKHVQFKENQEFFDDDEEQIDTTTGAEKRRKLA